MHHNMALTSERQRRQHHDLSWPPPAKHPPECINLPLRDSARLWWSPALRPFLFLHCCRRARRWRCICLPLACGGPRAQKERQAAQPPPAAPAPFYFSASAAASCSLAPRIRFPTSGATHRAHSRHAAASSPAPPRRSCAGAAAPAVQTRRSPAAAEKGPPGGSNVRVSAARVGGAHPRPWGALEPLRPRQARERLPEHVGEQRRRRVVPRGVGGAAERRDEDLRPRTRLQGRLHLRGAEGPAAGRVGVRCRDGSCAGMPRRGRGGGGGGWVARGALAICGTFTTASSRALVLRERMHCSGTFEWRAAAGGRASGGASGGGRGVPGVAQCGGDHHHLGSGDPTRL